MQSQAAPSIPQRMEAGNTSHHESSSPSPTQNRRRLEDEPSQRQSVASPYSTQHREIGTSVNTIAQSNLLPHAVAPTGHLTSDRKLL